MRTAKRAAYEKEYRRVNPQVMKAARARWKAKDPIRWRVVAKKNSAKRHGHEWALSSRLAGDLFTDVCFYCGAPPEPYNEIDRVDNVRGYVEDNVVACCRMCNVAKNKYTLAQFASWLHRASKHSGQWRELVIA